MFCVLRLAIFIVKLPGLVDCNLVIFALGTLIFLAETEIVLNMVIDTASAVVSAAIFFISVPSLIKT